MPEQAKALVDAGVPEHAIHVEELPRTMRRKPAVERLTERAMAISQCRRGDKLTVTELSVVALSAPDLLNVLRALGERSASLLDLSDNQEYRWHSEAESAAAALAKWEIVRKEVQTRNARMMLREINKTRTIRGRLPALTDKQKVEARADWRNPLLSTAEIARKWKVSRPTLHNYFGPRFIGPPPPKRRKRKVKIDV